VANPAAVSATGIIIMQCGGASIRKCISLCHATVPAWARQGKIAGYCPAEARVYVLRKTLPSAAAKRTRAVREVAFRSFVGDVLESGYAGVEDPHEPSYLASCAVLACLLPADDGRKVKILERSARAVRLTFSMRNARWLRLLAYVTGSVNQELLIPNEYLAPARRTRIWSSSLWSLSFPETPLSRSYQRDLEFR